jgi:hypothetical protein
MSQSTKPKPKSRKVKPAAGDVIDFDALSDAQKERVYRDAQAIRPGEGKPLTAAQKALHARIRRKVGRPKIGKGAERVNVTIERGLLSEADRFARQQGITRAELIAAGLRRAMAP